MTNPWESDLALFVLRISVAYVFLYAAWKNTQNKTAWAWTINESSLLFQNLSPGIRQRMTRISAIGGMILMYGGGVSILLGIEPRVGGLFIAIFSLVGIRIHAIRRDEAHKAADEGNQMGWSAYSAHVAAGLKNWALIGTGITFFLLGAGTLSLGVDNVGRILGL